MFISGFILRSCNESVFQCLLLKSITTEYKQKSSWITASQSLIPRAHLSISLVWKTTALRVLYERLLALTVVFKYESVSYDELLRLAELPSLVNRKLQEIAILMFKVKKTQSQVQELFMLRANSDRIYSLRNSDFNLPCFNTIKYGKHLLRYYGPTYKGITCRG